ncbi:MAG: hypothetical protein K2F87_02790, partial [Muribaculaceae bacterium]|nr:hypothetical protein [Muribaculaceae bacterium]
DNLPDFLTEEGTNLVLGDPQLYIAINNPVSNYDLVASTDMAFYQQRNGVVDLQNPMTLPGGLTINADETNEYVHHFALSPEGQSLQIPTVSYLAAYETSATVKQPYPELSNVLAGNGLPEALDVRFDGTKVKGTAADFELGKNIKGLHGSYIFRAPLTLKDGSQIIKSGTEDDWSSEDLDRLNVEEMQLNTTVTSTLPMAVKLTAQVRNTAGQHVGKCNAVEIPAMATDYPVVLTIDAVDGKYINNIDGIYYEATMVVPGSQEATLSPEQTLVLKNVRAKVTGYYLYEDK